MHGKGRRTTSIDFSGCERALQAHNCGITRAHGLPQIIDLLPQLRPLLARALRAVPFRAGTHSALTLCAAVRAPVHCNTVKAGPCKHVRR